MFDQSRRHESVGAGAVASSCGDGVTWAFGWCVLEGPSRRLLAEIYRSRDDIARYRAAVEELRRVLAVLETNFADPDQTG
jgi:hypothetical protein